MWAAKEPLPVFGGAHALLKEVGLRNDEFPKPALLVICCALREWGSIWGGVMRESFLGKN